MQIDMLYSLITLLTIIFIIVIIVGMNLFIMRMSEDRQYSGFDFYKHVDIKEGNYGYKYKIGINIDPKSRPYYRIRQCEYGAFYFTTKEFLSEYYSGSNHIARLHPVGNYEQRGKKWISHKVFVREILPVNKAIIEWGLPFENMNMYADGLEELLDYVLTRPDLIFDLRKYLLTYGDDVLLDTRLIMSKRCFKKLLRIRNATFSV